MRFVNAVGNSGVDMFAAARKNQPKETVKEMFSQLLKEKQAEGSETQMHVLVKPDGSRVLIVTMHIGGRETTMSLEISKPTETSV